jgi:hypothetical protein
VGPTFPADVEREYKFLLSREQHLGLWRRLREGGRLRAQENIFFDRDRVLQHARWLLRLRLEREAESRSAIAESPPADDLDWGVAAALVTLKGPSVSVTEGVVRPEIEDAFSVEKAISAASTGVLSSSELPIRLRDSLRDQTGNDVPDVFVAFARFHNLRLARRIATGNGGIEVALDRARAGDGRVRHELEVEWREGDEDAARAVLADLGTDAFRPTSRGKLSWLMETGVG